MTEILDGQTRFLDLASPATRMSPEPSPVPTERTSELSLKSLLGSKTRQPLCLMFPKADGHTPMNGAVKIGAWRGEFLTRSTGAAPSETEKAGMLFKWVRRTAGNESTLCATSTDTPPEKFCLDKAILTDVIDPEADPKYTLSAKACLGIVRRAGRRGKLLPEVLAVALWQRILREPIDEEILTDLRNEYPEMLADAMGELKKRYAAAAEKAKAGVMLLDNELIEGEDDEDDMELLTAGHDDDE